MMDKRRQCESMLAEKMQEKVNKARIIKGRAMVKKDKQWSMGKKTDMDGESKTGYQGWK